MPFHADLHVHSKYSRATSRDLDLEHLAWWAARKGIAVTGTGDCVHPGWLAEIKDRLVPAEGGLYALKPEIEAEIFKTLPPSCRTAVRFMLTVEISTIYKKAERTRKVHHLICLPDFDTADRLAASLARIGNIASDGRPILGLDSRDLLEITLASGPHSTLVPAHIWTPWFSALGSQSGFDSIAECYGDLADRIFAVETGLSSDPEMNWRVSSLDRYRLVSNSDAHSPGKLGREATRFSCAPDFFAMRRALETGDGYDGTVEFFPEEGKYHLDGHRACGVRLEPAETIAAEGRCPVCGGRVTVGVAHRVEMLADRAHAAAPPNAGPVKSLVPLPEILSEILRSGDGSQGVARAYDRATAELGAELSILEETPVEDIARVEPLLGEAVSRLRSGAVIRQAGYDGEYGVIRLFEDGELDRLTSGGMLFDAPIRRRARAPKKTAAPLPESNAPAVQPAGAASSGRHGVLAALDADQALAAEADGPLVVIAGPGSGKTRMLTHRLAHLVLERGVPAHQCLALTFTRRTTAELRQRLAVLMGEPCAVESFHSLGLQILRAESAAAGLRADFRIADAPERAAALAADLDVMESKAGRLLGTISLLKRTGREPRDQTMADTLAAYRRLSLEQNWVDFDDLIAMPVRILESDAAVRARWRVRHLCIDEFQDVDEQQYRLLCLLADRDICAIGDPNQAIYGFRGADATCFARFLQDFLSARTLRLGRNYRSTGSIVAAAAQVIGSGEADDVMRPLLEPVTLHAAPTEWAEADFVAAQVEALLGGHDMLAAHGKKSETARPLGFADFAVLYRTDAQAAALREAFDRAGIPYKKSTPAPLAGQAAVRALLAALKRQDSGVALPARIAAAAERLQRDGETEIAALAAARHWLSALATGDEAQLRERVALSTEADFWDPRAERVSLLTMHAAKGLEFAIVFVVGLEDGLVPFAWGAPHTDGPEDTPTEGEERRLFYVAMTRAKDRLFLTRAEQRTWRGETRRLPPSRFLADIAPELVREHATRKSRADTRQYSLF